jgi:hypothetical protein
MARRASQPLDDLRGRLGLSFAEAAAALGVSERHLRSLRRELPVAQLGGKLVLPVDSLREWLRRRAEQGTAKTDAAVSDLLGKIESAVSNHDG